MHVTVSWIVASRNKQSFIIAAINIHRRKVDLGTIFFFSIYTLYGYHVTTTSTSYLNAGRTWCKWVFNINLPMFCFWKWQCLCRRRLYKTPVCRSTLAALSLFVISVLLYIVAYFTKCKTWAGKKCGASRLKNVGWKLELSQAIFVSIPKRTPPITKLYGEEVLGNHVHLYLVYTSE